MPLTSEVRCSPEPSARPSAVADSEEWQICVANVIAEMGRDLVSTTARLSDLSMPLKGEVRRSPEPSARQPIARSGNLYDVLIRGERWIVFMLSPIVRDVVHIQRQRCAKRGSGDGQRLSLYD